MPDFLDHLLKQGVTEPTERARVLYDSEIRRLIEQSPPVRRTPRTPGQAAQLALRLERSPSSTPFSTLSSPAIFLYDLEVRSTLPLWFREAKERETRRPFWRADAVRDEKGILETRAMGADAYCLEVGAFDLAALQYLCEYGRDYELPAILRCRTEEELALALQIKDQTLFWLADILAAPQLLELELLQGLTMIMEPTQGSVIRGVWDCTVSVVQSDAVDTEEDHYHRDGD